MLPSDQTQQVLLQQQLLHRRLARQLASANATPLPQTSNAAVSAAFAAAAAAASAPLTAVSLRPSTMMGPGGGDDGHHPFQAARQTMTSSSSSSPRRDASSLLRMMLASEQERRLLQRLGEAAQQQQQQQQQHQLPPAQIQQLQRQQPRLSAQGTPEGLVPSSSATKGTALFGAPWTRRSEFVASTPPIKAASLATLPKATVTVPAASKLEQRDAKETTTVAKEIITSSQADNDKNGDGDTRESRAKEGKDLKRKAPTGGVSRKDARWEEMYQELLSYKRKTGTCIVPRGFAENPRLASWVAEQRKQYKLMRDGRQSSITPKRVELLNQVDFAWNAQEAAWEKHMVDLKTFKNKHGHCNVPLSDPQFPKLGLWVKEQRRHYTLMKQGKQSHMTEARCSELDSVGFCWDTHEATWLERLNELLSFKKANGHCIVPTNYPQNPKLGTWIHHQRRQYKKYKEGKPCHITAERVKALDSLGFVWHPREKCAETNGVEEKKKSATDLACLDLRPRKRQRHT